MLDKPFAEHSWNGVHMAEDFSFHWPTKPRHL